MCVCVWNEIIDRKPVMINVCIINVLVMILLLLMILMIVLIY